MRLSSITGVIVEEVMFFGVLFPKIARVVQWMMSRSISHFSEVEFPICRVLSFLSRDSAKFCVRLSSDILLTLMLGIPCFFEVWNFFGCTAESWTPDGCLYESLCWGLVLKYELVIHRLWKVHSSSRCAGCFRSFCLRLTYQGESLSAHILA